MPTYPVLVQWYSYIYVRIYQNHSSSSSRILINLSRIYPPLVPSFSRRRRRLSYFASSQFSKKKSNDKRRSSSIVLYFVSMEDGDDMKFFAPPRFVFHPRKSTMIESSLSLFLSLSLSLLWSMSLADPFYVHIGTSTKHALHLFFYTLSTEFMWNSKARKIDTFITSDK